MIPHDARTWVVAACAVALAMAAFYVLLPVIVQKALRLALFPHYGFRIVGRENVPPRGPVLIAANHTSWIDGFILAAVTPRRGRAMVNAALVNLPVVKQLAVRAGIIPTPYTGPRAIMAALKLSREALERGEAVGIFPEGQISRNGLPQPFLRGLEVILKGQKGVPVIPVAIDNLWGSLFSRSQGRFFTKRPQALRRTVNVLYGAPLYSPVTAFELRQALLELSVRAYEYRKPPVPALDSLDPTLPKWEHSSLGPLTGSTPDVVLPGINQIGHKDGTVGHAVPGVAIRVVDESGTPLGPDVEGRVQALVAHRGGWHDTGRRGSIEPDGFVKLIGPTEK